MAQEKYTERFDAPIPGQSLTDTPGNYPWEHPSQFSTVEEASEYIWDRLHDTKMAEQIIYAKKRALGSYPWEQCIRDQKKKYGSEKTAKKICGYIKSKYGG